MKLTRRAAGALAVLCLAANLLPAEKLDFTQHQSPPRPAPKWHQFSDEEVAALGKVVGTPAAAQPWLRKIDQGAHDPRLKGYFTPEGVKVEIVADFPTVRNPVGMTFADDGTPYVLEWVPDVGSTFPEFPETFTYKDGSKRQVATMKKRVKDVVKVLRYNKDKDVYDQAQVVLEDELPSSILLHDGWLYLSGRGTVRRFKQSKPDQGADAPRSPYDVKEVIAQGFCGFHHHQVSGMTVGNEGWLYLTSGDDDNYVEGSDGSRATVLRTGAVFRCRPDGSKMHVFSLGYRNPYRDVAFDKSFNVFHVDNDNEDGSKFQGCRLMHVAEGSDFGWRLFVGARCCKPDHVRGAVGGELPGKVPPMLKTGRGSPAGLLIYNDTRFPEAYRGLLCYPDVFRKVIRAYKVEPDGSTFAVAEEFELLKSDDPLFRPCQMVAGPDGAMYVVDWRTDSGGAGQLWGDGKHGRIYRLTWAGTKQEPALPRRGLDSWAKVLGQSDEELFKTLAGDEFTDRQKAQRELVRRGAKQRPALLKLVADGGQPTHARLAALGALQSFWDDDVQAAFLRLLEDREADVRRLAADGLALNVAPGDKKVTASLLAALGDPDPAVRRAVALAMGQVGAPGAADNLVNALAFDDGKDVYLTDGLVRAIERQGKHGVERLLALSHSGDQKGIDKAVDAFLALRTRHGAEAVPGLLTNPHLSIAQRAGLLRSYTNYQLDPPVSVEPVLEYLAKHPREDPSVKRAGLEAVAAGGQLRGDKARALLLGLLDENDSGSRLLLLKAVEETRLAKASATLARWLGDASRPHAERLATVKTLGVLKDPAAAPAIKEVLDKAPGTKAEAAALRLEAFRALAALDPAAAQEAARQFVQGGDRALQAEAVQVLGTRPDGAKEIGRLFLDKKLPRELLPQVSEALRKHAAKDAELAKMQTEVMKSGLLLSTDKAEVERVRALVRSKGSAQRGRALYLDGRTLACVNCHKLEGVGGSVGPDLTRLWETHSLDKILEALIEPSKEIKEGYQAYVATTKKGQTFTGLKVAQTAGEVVLREAGGKDVRLALADLEELTASKQSLMPDNVVAQLSYDQFIDLVAFLQDRAAQESLRGLALDFWAVGPFPEDLKARQPPEDKPDPEATYPGSRSGEKLAWQAVQAGPNGLLDLRALFGKDHASAYVLTYVHSPRAQKAQMLLGSSGPARVWLNGALVHENTAARSAKPDEDRVEVSLKEGWNAVLVKVAGGAGGHGLYLRFADGQGLRVARTPDGK